AHRVGLAATAAGAVELDLVSVLGEDEVGMRDLAPPETHRPARRRRRRGVGEHDGDTLLLLGIGYIWIHQAHDAPPSRRRIVAMSVMIESPANSSAASERRAASAWPAPQASATITGTKARSAACRAVGSIPTSMARPAMATALTPQSRSAIDSGVPSNADMVILSKIASLA